MPGVAVVDGRQAGKSAYIRRNAARKPSVLCGAARDGGAVCLPRSGAASCRPALLLLVLLLLLLLLLTKARPLAYYCHLFATCAWHRPVPIFLLLTTLESH